jgi:hypothetical protein
MEKNNCYIYWDDDTVPELEQKVYIQCEECFKKNRKGFKWSKTLWQGSKEVKCNLCDTIIYSKKKKNQKSIGENKESD